MTTFCFLRVLALVSHLTLLDAVESNVICQNLKFVIDEEDVYTYHIIEGHVLKRLTDYSAG